MLRKGTPAGLDSSQLLAKLQLDCFQRPTHTHFLCYFSYHSPSRGSLESVFISLRHVGKLHSFVTFTYMFILNVAETVNLLIVVVLEQTANPLIRRLSPI